MGKILTQSVYFSIDVLRQSILKGKRDMEALDPDLVEHLASKIQTTLYPHYPPQQFRADIEPKILQSFSGLGQRAQTWDVLELPAL